MGRQGTRPEGRPAARKKDPRPKPAYHHGDLRKALLDAARALLREGGPDACSLREIARRAGVSHAAPYHHFKSLEQLLAAVAEQGFMDMDRTMMEAQGAAPPDAEAQLVAVGMGYIVFARRDSSLFRLMIAPEYIGPPQPGSPLELAGPYARLLSGLARLRGLPAPAVCGPDADAHLCWATVHGVAQLELDSALGVDGLAYARVLVERLVRALAIIPRVALVEPVPKRMAAKPRRRSAGG